MENQESEKELKTEQAPDPREAENAALKDRLKQAVAAYRESLLKANPDVPPDMVGGDSLEEVSDSLFSAKKMLGRMRRIVEAEQAAAKVPAGPSTRSDADLSGLSPREKIQYGIGGK
jgi:hypothetical protein